MKRTLLLALVLSVVAAGVRADDPAPKPDPATARKQASYGIGLNVGNSLKRDGFEVDVEQLAAGVKDALAGAEPKLTPAQIRAAIEVFQEQIVAKLQEPGNAFLRENGKKPGVKTTASGLQYKVTTPGTGPSPKATDTVKVHYHGTLTDGTVFDSSVKRMQPATFPLNRVIKGWTEGLQLMKVGSKTTFYVPSQLAYGANPPPGSVIPPHSVLVFEVELLDIEQ